LGVCTRVQPGAGLQHACTKIVNPKCLVWDSSMGQIKMGYSSAQASL
jgi:hypothetical protein